MPHMSEPGRRRSDAQTQGRDSYFDASCVDGTSELQVAYAIRYQVYCVERGFLERSDYPDGLERDEYDAMALHILARHRSGEPAGTARLVMHSPLGFPVMRHCRFSGEYEYLNDPAHPAHLQGAEISRLAISKAFRMRAGDTFYGGFPRAESAQRAAGDGFGIPRNTPEILVGICRLIYQESKRRGVTHWVLAMERSLHVMLNRVGFKFVPAGPEVDYYGPVRPYYNSVERFEAELYRASSEKLRYFIQGLEPDLVPDFIRGARGNGTHEAAIA